MTVDTTATRPDVQDRVPVEPDVDREPLVESEVLVEEVSIDGMCGVY